MTVFGRDTLITCLQTLLFGPELARGALRALAALQATDGRPVERRRAGQDRARAAPRASARRSWFDRYYGTVDATPLFLVLLSEVWRWTGRRGARAASCGAGAARRCAGSTSTATATATASSSTSGARQRGLDEPVVEGLRRLAALPRRPARAGADRAVRGAGLRLRREAPDGGARARGLARRRARRPARGARPTTLRARFDEAFWVEERGGYYALALDGDKQPRRLALLEHRPSALERHRPAGARRRGRRRADRRRALVGLGRAHDVDAATPRTTRSATTTARSGRTTTR